MLFTCKANKTILFVCSKWSSLLQLFFRWIHSGYRPFQCRFCPKSFRHQNHVKNHEVEIDGAILTIGDPPKQKYFILDQIKMFYC